jgi:hypothetical protein
MEQPPTATREAIPRTASPNAKLQKISETCAYPSKAQPKASARPVPNQNGHKQKSDILRKSGQTPVTDAAIVPRGTIWEAWNNSESQVSCRIRLRLRPKGRKRLDGQS